MEWEGSAARVEMCHGALARWARSLGGHEEVEAELVVRRMERWEQGVGDPRLPRGVELHLRLPWSRVEVAWAQLPPSQRGEALLLWPRPESIDLLLGPMAPGEEGEELRARLREAGAQRVRPARALAGLARAVGSLEETP